MDTSLITLGLLRVASHQQKSRWDRDGAMFTGEINPNYFKWPIKNVLLKTFIGMTYWSSTF